ncbi:hypothetical protein GE061_002701 [Apolygus lucorum]|uniref:Uncharacterized protein n=1 Tax=Apolygus lucorum TaxID=248454 RepID=A0A6A4JAA1_APOLU|nr:hypothetical protein GE061_002701 [Apolygus lucorum]
MLALATIRRKDIGVQNSPPSSRKKKQKICTLDIKNDPGMDFISNLPIELLEEIFLYLESDDLVKCSYVCLQWREVINSNKIWSLQCFKDRIQQKEYLQTSWSLISNPVKVYRDHVFDPEATRLTIPCHWRSHYNRYKFLERNWRKGNYSLIRTKVNAQHYIGGLLISMDHNGLTAYNIQNLKNPMHIKKANASKDVDAVRVKGNLLFYTQERNLVCMKRFNASFTKHYEITVPTYLKEHSNHRAPTESTLALKITDKFLVIQDLTNACFLYFYDYKTGESLRKVDLHTYTGNSCPQFTCLEAFEDKVFVAYGLYQHYVMIYDFKTDKVDVKVETSLRSSELVVSKNFFCSKLVVNQLEKSCELHVWSVHNGEEVDLLCTNRHLPVLLTPDDKLIYSEHHTVYVRGLVNSNKDVEFTVEGRLQSMEPIWGNLLVLNLGFSLQLWDLSSGQKLHTYLRDSIEDMWVDDRHIVVKHTSRPWLTCAGYIIGFW